MSDGIEEIREFLGDLIPASATFVLRRTKDVTGLSGTGVVADGAVFPDGRTVTRWRGGTTGVAQTCVWDNLGHVQRIHGHDGATKLEFVPYGVLVAMILAALNAELPDEHHAEVVRSLVAVLHEHREREAEMEKAARG